MSVQTSRLKASFDAARSAQRKLLIPYITAGDPRPATTVPLMHALVAAGADVIELGVPFSDPMADGPVIQAACERALAQHVSLRSILGMVGEFRKQDAHTPVVLMGYLNPIETMGYGEFASAAAGAGVDGALIVDLVPEESADISAVLHKAGLDTIFLAAPTSTDERLQAISRAATGYVYYVSLKGVTGANRLDVDSVAEKLQQMRHFTELPIAVGFGIRDAASAAQVGRIADAVIVGSALVSRIAKLCNDGTDVDEEAILREVPAILNEMRTALDKPDSPSRRKQA